jgi:hypothetical protein
MLSTFLELVFLSVGYEAKRLSFMKYRIKIVEIMYNWSNL